MTPDYHYRARMIFVGATAVILGAVQANAAPKSDLWEVWTHYDSAATRVIDHQAWERFLATHLVPGADGVNRVAYGRVAGADKQALESYIQGLAATPIGAYGRSEQLAYWINLYNALTVKVVLDHYPVDSIRDIDISPGFFADGPWDRKLVEIKGEQVSLNDIEHRILRPIWRDPRIHYAVNCASLGCPNLARSAYTGDNVESLLTIAAGDFVNHERGVRLVDRRLVVSSIYSWFQDDFGADEREVIAHLRRYAAPDLAQRLAKVTAIDDDYDWTLNDAPKP